MQDYPDYMSQGESIDDLEQNLKDVFKELTGGQIPCVRRVGQFSIT
jgi:predicted RNase H-like HicB family nuclease